MLLEAAQSQGGKPKVDRFLSIKDIERLTPFHLAVMNGNIEVWHSSTIKLYNKNYFL